MAWQRKIPFGYRMENGRIVLHTEEADAVAFIYDSYIRGESYLNIAAAMSKLSIRYHEATAEWNKHMVKRMLENPKYTGQEPYPAILSDSVWRQAQAVRSRKTAGHQPQSTCVEMLKRRMVCGECGTPFSKITPTNKQANRWWHCGNPDCSCTLKMNDGALEEAVTTLLNRLIVQPELLNPAQGAEPALSLEVARMQNEINRELSKPELNEEYLTALIFGCAAEKYDLLDDVTEQRQTAVLKVELQSQPLRSAFDPELFEKAAEALLVGADGSLALRLKGGNIVTQSGKENIDNECNH